MVLLAVVLASGCVSPSRPQGPADPAASSVLLDGLAVHHGDGRILAASAYAGDLPSFEQRFVSMPHFDLAHWPGFEPTVDFTPDGTAFFSTFSTPMETEYAPAWQGARQTSVLVAASDDRGRTWRDVSPPPAFPDFDTSATPVRASLLHGGDTMSYVDLQTGDLFVSALAPPCAVVHRTGDRGDSWSSAILCDTQGQAQMDHQAFFTGRSTALPTTGGAPVVYLCWSGLVFTKLLDIALGQESPLPSPASQRCMASFDGGNQFVPISPPFLANDRACWPYMSQGAMTAPDGTMYLPQGFCGRMDVAVSRDNGLTWDVVTVDSEHGASPDQLDEGEGRIAIDAAGNVYHAWIDGDMLPRYAVSRDGGRTWGPSIPVQAPGINVTARPSIVAGDDGRIALSYLAANTPGGSAFVAGVGTPLVGPAPPGPDLELLATLEWSAVTSISLDALAADPVFASVRINPAGDPVHRGYDFGGIEDYADNGLDPLTGAVWWSSGDTCHVQEALCPVEPLPRSRYWEKPSRGYVGVQVGGTGLLADRQPIP